MRNPHGYGLLTDPRESRPIEIDTFMCGHCNRHSHVKPGQRPEDIGGLCKQCMELVCPLCVGKDCTPLIKWIEELENKARFRREITG